MKKISITLLSLVAVGISYGKINDQHILTEKLNKENRNYSVEALVNTMREIEVEKEKAGEVSDTVCKALPWRYALVGGVVNSLNAMLFCASDRKQFKQYLETQEILNRGIFGFILGSIGTWIGAKILFGLSEARRIKRNVEKRVEQQYQPEREALKEKIHQELISDTISGDEKTELIAHLERDCGVGYKNILKK